VVAIEALVAAGIGVATIPGLALRAHRHPDVNTYEIPEAARHVYVATYGEPPDPPATAAPLDVLVSLA
jgi:DNA-binding transcriptional LysR family regulator